MNAYATHNGVTGSDYLHRPCANVPRLGPSVRRNCSEGFSSPPNTGSQQPPACLKMGSSLLSSSKHFVYELVGVSIAPTPWMATVSHQFFSKCGRSFKIDRIAARRTCDDAANRDGLAAQAESRTRRPRMNSHENLVPAEGYRHVKMHPETRVALNATVIGDV